VPPKFVCPLQTFFAQKIFCYANNKNKNISLLNRYFLSNLKTWLPACLTVRSDDMFERKRERGHVVALQVDLSRWKVLFSNQEDCAAC